MKIVQNKAVIGQSEEKNFCQPEGLKLTSSYPLVHSVSVWLAGSRAYLPTPGWCRCPCSYWGLQPSNRTRSSAGWSNCNAERQRALRYKTNEINRGEIWTHNLFVVNWSVRVEKNGSCLWSVSEDSFKARKREQLSSGLLLWKSKRYQGLSTRSNLLLHIFPRINHKTLLTTQHHCLLLEFKI